MRHIFPNGAACDANIKAFGSVQGAIDTTDRLASHLVTMPGDLDFIVARVGGRYRIVMSGRYPTRESLTTRWTACTSKWSSPSAW